MPGYSTLRQIPTPGAARVLHAADLHRTLWTTRRLLQSLIWIGDSLAAGDMASSMLRARPSAVRFRPVVHPEAEVPSAAGGDDDDA